MYLMFALAFAAVTFFHFLSLVFEKKYSLYTKYFGRKGFWVHAILTGILWLVLWGLYLNISSQEQPTDSILSYTGYFFQAAGIVIVLWSGRILGIRRTWGIGFFDRSFIQVPEQRGLFGYLQNPMYTGIALCFLGEWLISGIFSYAVFGIESYVLLNIFLARFENAVLKR